MSIFISYSHSDKTLVDNIAADLVAENAHIWIDTWELKVGDSIINKIQEAIVSSSALLVVLSKTSVSSEWCKKELSAGLIRELSEKKVIVLPVLIEDCEIPIFLKDKMYADFRSDYKKGIKAVIDAIASVENQNQGRLSDSGVNIDWSIDWGYDNSLFHLRFVLVEHSQYPFSILTEVNIICNETATNRYRRYEEINLDWLGRTIITESLGNLTDNKSYQILLEDHFPQINTFEVRDSKLNISFKIAIQTRRLGEDTGKNLLVNIGNYLEMIRSHMIRSGRKLTDDEQKNVMHIINVNSESTRLTVT